MPCCYCCCYVASVVSDSVRPHRRESTRLPCPWDSPGKNTGVGCHFLLQCMKVESEREVAQLCPTPSDPMDCSLPGSSIHGIFQARVLEWGAIAFSEHALTPIINLFYIIWSDIVMQPWLIHKNLDFLKQACGKWATCRYSLKKIFFPTALTPIPSIVLDT